MQSDSPRGLVGGTELPERHPRLVRGVGLFVHGEPPRERHTYFVLANNNTARALYVRSPARALWVCFFINRFFCCWCAVRWWGRGQAARGDSVSGEAVRVRRAGLVHAHPARAQARVSPLLPQKGERKAERAGERNGSWRGT